MKKPHFIKFSNFDFYDGDFSINIVEMEADLNMTVKRFYFLESLEGSYTRGNHAHLNQDQIFIKQKGLLEVKLTSRDGAESFWKLENNPLFVPANYWIEVFLSKHSSVLCLASQSYKNLISISDKEEFLRKEL